MRRKLRNSKYRQLGVPSLFIVGGGFIILLFIGYFLLDYDNYRKVNAGYSYDDLKSKNAVINEVETYDFINYALLDGDNILNDSMEFMKINCFSIKHSSELESFIKTVSNSILTDEDKRFMKNQLENTTYLWDNQKLLNAWCLTPKDYAKINISDTSDYWEEFRKNFGNYGRHRYSKPIFNKNKTFCIIEHTGQGGWLFGSGEVLLFKKVNKTWKLIKETTLWMS